MKKQSIFCLSLLLLSNTVIATPGTHEYQVKTYIENTPAICSGHWIDGKRHFCIETSKSYVFSKLCTTCGEYGEVRTCTIQLDIDSWKSNMKENH